MNDEGRSFQRRQIDPYGIITPRLATYVHATCRTLSTLVTGHTALSAGLGPDQTKFVYGND